MAIENRTTQAEERFRNKIVYRLRLDGYQGEIWFNVVLVCDGRLLCPDIYLPDVGLAIEVDGRRHDSNEWQLAKDSDRDELYHSMGIWLYRITNLDAVTEGKANGRVTEIMALIRSFKHDLERILNARKAITAGHDAFLTKHPNMREHLLGDFRTGNVGDQLRPMHHYRWFDGIRLKLAPFHP